MWAIALNMPCRSKVMPYYQYSPTIVNLCEDGYDEDRLRASHPRAYFVHSKGPQFNATEMLVRDTYWEVLHHYLDKGTLYFILYTLYYILVGAASLPGQEDRAERRGDAPRAGWQRQ